MKNAITILLISIFTFNLGGYHLLLKIQQRNLRKEVKQKIKQGIAEEELAIITITPENKDALLWKHDKEFMFEGEMYDVVYAETINEGTTVYHALPDKKEHELIEKFLEKIKKNRSKNQRTNTQNFFKVVIKIPPTTYKQEAIAFEEHPKSVFNYTNLYHSILLEISSPPPKQV